MNTAKSKLSEIAVLWREIRNNQDLKEIFQYGCSEFIWKNVVSMHEVVDEFCDSKGSDQYEAISQFLSNYKMYLQANRNIKSGERKEVISKITSIAKYFEEKTSCHGELGSRDNKAKVNELGKTYENVEQSKPPKDAEKRAQNMVDTDAEDEKTQRAQRGREHDERKDENEIELHLIEKRRDEIKQEIDGLVGTTSHAKLYELTEYLDRLMLAMYDLDLPRGSDVHIRKIKMLKEVYQYSDIPMKKAMENEFLEVETYIAELQKNIGCYTNSENFGKCRDGIVKIKMRLREINASVDSEKRKSKCMDVINNMEEILETMEYAAKRGEGSTILSEQKEKNDAKIHNNELTNDVDNIGLVDHGLSNIERNEEELDSIEKMNRDHDPQEIIVKFEQFD
ncbi:hypothetical protein JTB14_031530 [Gonioctena quinquepunctata]|nr:hypothetical protein JTB14_031530 [Gonioctena quinquepunctata]